MRSYRVARLANDSLDCAVWKNLTNKTSTFLNKTAESVSKSTQSPAVQKFGASAAEGLSKLSLQAQQGGTYVWNTGRQTTEGLVSRFSPTGLVAMCQAESKYGPEQTLL